jgi:hypothetical protein
MIFKQANRVFDFEEFLIYAQSVVEKNEAHPELVADERYAFYTKLNLQRMKRWIKTFVPDQELVERLKQSKHVEWWVITEAWCGDSAQNLPALAGLAKAADISLKIVLRDENLEIMDQYLTNGTRSIPILVSFDAKEQQTFVWGPRPKEAQLLMDEWKANPGGRAFEDFELEMHQWYTANKAAALQAELKAII